MTRRDEPGIDQGGDRQGGFGERMTCGKATPIMNGRGGLISGRVIDGSLKRRDRLAELDFSLLSEDAVVDFDVTRRPPLRRFR
ncbi:hypothetical protein IP78_13810 [Brevundimonas sp. AAP58]|nr:hypothetical protein IP78_13810 [Brevundimonas sp. AAP58]